MSRRRLTAHGYLWLLLVVSACVRGLLWARYGFAIATYPGWAMGAALAASVSGFVAVLLIQLTPGPLIRRLPPVVK